MAYVNSSPLVQFAQKAAAISKAAGFDPKTIDLEAFRRLAPIIFSRAYCAIYQERLVSDIEEFSSREDQILNSQLVIDGLTAKTRNPSLATISGIDIFQGNHRAVGILAGVLFAEGQRLWLERSKSKPATEPKPEQQSARSPTGEAAMVEAGNARYREGVSPDKVDALLHRISYLESRLRRKPGKEGRGRPSSSHGRNTTKKRGRSNSRQRKSDDDESPERRVGDAAQQEAIESSSAPGHAASRPHEEKPEEDIIIPNDDDSTLSDDQSGLPIAKHETNKEAVIDRPIEPGRPRPSRPTSAPATRRHNKAMEVSERLYRPPLTTKELLEVVKAPAKPKPPTTNPLFTYDMKSGRRILVANAERDRQLRMEAQKAMGNLNIVTDDDEHLMGGGHSRPKSANNVPQPPQYPCKRIEKSVEEWVKRARTDAGVEDPQAAAHKHDLPQSRPLGLYQNMEALDFLVSIEHCHNCEHHQITTRHNPLEYKRQADEFLRVLAEETLKLGLCVRVGVLRLEADITAKSRPSDENCRIGAFEVQLACRGPRGEAKSTLIHSKLHTGRWPAKSVLEKRLQSFVSQMHLPTYHYAGDGIGLTDYESVMREGQNYPVGRCHFSDTMLADPHWSFARFSHHPWQDIRAVTWVFDTRGLQNLPRFSLHTTVNIRNVHYAPGQIEKHPLIGVVARYEDSSQQPANVRMMFIQLKYHAADDLIRVAESDVSGHDDSGDTITQGLAAGLVSKLPFDFEAFYLTCKKEQLVSWQVHDDMDQVVNASRGEYILTRKSMFLNVRRFAWQLVSLFKKRGATLVHPVSGRLFDPHLCYSERMLWKLHELFALPMNTLLLDEAIVAAATPKGNNNNNKKQQMAASPAHSIASTAASGAGAGAVAESGTTSPRPSDMQSSASPITVSHSPPPAVNNNNSNTSNNSNSSSSSAAQAKLLLLKRPANLNTQASTESLALIRSRLLSMIRKPAADWLTYLQEHASSDDNDSVRMDEVMRSLYEFGLDSIAENVQELRTMTCFLSQDNDEMSSALSMNKLRSWIATEPQQQQSASAEEVRVSSARSAGAPAAGSAPGSARANIADDQQHQQQQVQETASDAQEHDHSDKHADATAAAAAEGENENKEQGDGGEEDDASVHSAVGPLPVVTSPRSPRSTATSPRDANNNSNASNAATATAAGADAASADENANAAATSPLRSKVAIPGGPVLTPGSNRHRPSTLIMASIPEGDALVLPQGPLSSTAAPAPAAGAGAAAGGGESAGDDTTANAATPAAPAVVEEDRTEYDNKDIVINSIVLDGAQLVNSVYDSLFLCLDLDHLHLEARVCLAREKGSKKRTFNVQSWPELAVNADQFRAKNMYLSVVVADTAQSNEHPGVPTVATTVLGSTRNSAAVPAKQMFASTFEISCQVYVPVIPNTPSTGATTPSSQPGTSSSSTVGGKVVDDGHVTITLHGMSKEAKAARVSRILSMKPVELLGLKFEPVALDDDDFDLDGEFDTDDDKSLASKRSRRSLVKKAAGAASAESLPASATATAAADGSGAATAGVDSQEMHDTLYPVASFQNLLAPLR